MGRIVILYFTSFQIITGTMIYVISQSLEPLVGDLMW